MEKSRRKVNAGRLAVFIGIIVVVIAALLLIIFALAKNNANQAKIVAISSLSPVKTVAPVSTDEPDSTPDSPDSPEATDSPQATGKVSINIKAVGDIAIQTDVLAGCYDSTADEYDFTGIFAEIAGHLEADLTLASFESVCVDKSVAAYSGKGSYNTPSSIAQAVAGAGIGGVTLANSHILDQGLSGLASTVSVFDEAGLATFGAYPTKEDADADGVTIMDVKGVNIAVISYTTELRGNLKNLSEDEQKFAVNVTDSVEILTDIQRAKDKGADVVIVCMHWGELFKSEPSSSMRSLAETLLTSGADVIIGTHPQQVQKITYKSVTRSGGETQDVVVAYSLGNFVSEYRDQYQDSGIILDLNIEKDMETGVVTINKPTYIPTYIDKYLDNGTYKFRVVAINDYMDSQGSMTSESHTRMKAAYNEITGVIGTESATPAQ